ncbi:hypothetical protein [Niabella aquatica]
MGNRILKDIRYYESDRPNIEGQSMPQELGRLFIPTKDTSYIGQRIARKLNELQYSFGQYDHIYINLTTILAENQIQISARNIDKTIKYIDFGVHPTKFNAFTEAQKDSFLKSSTVDILEKISTEFNLPIVKEMAGQLSEFDTELTIHYKTKEASSYRISIYYQIAPKESFTKAIIEYRDKKTNSCYTTNFRLKFYDDIYSLVDTATFKNSTIILKPKKSFRAALYNERYKTPIELNINDFEKCDCR